MVKKRATGAKQHKKKEQDKARKPAAANDAGSAPSAEKKHTDAQDEAGDATMQALNLGDLKELKGDALLNAELVRLLQLARTTEELQGMLTKVAVGTLSEDEGSFLHTLSVTGRDYAEAVKEEPRSHGLRPPRVQAFLATLALLKSEVGKVPGGAALLSEAEAWAET